MLDGFRYGFIGHAEGSVLAGAAIVGALAFSLTCLCLWMFETGYKIKT